MLRVASVPNHSFLQDTQVKTSPTPTGMEGEE